MSYKATQRALAAGIAYAPGPVRPEQRPADFEKKVKWSQTMFRENPDLIPSRFPGYAEGNNEHFEALWRDGHIRKVCKYNMDTGMLQMVGFDGPAINLARAQVEA